MPELPEVETLKLGLKRYMVGHKILKVEVRDRKVLQGDEKDLIGAKVRDVRRFAKVLAIDLSNNVSIVVHVKLTGQLIYRGPNLKSPPPLSRKVLGLGDRHTHVIFKLDRDGVLYYNDVRRFGWIKVLKTNQVADLDFIKKLGPEPLVDSTGSPQARLTFSKFKEILAKYKTAIKVVLMDQEKIGGIGNIYANDALWLSKIHPKTPANKLDDKKQKDLYEAVLTVLKSGIKYGGASELAFVTSEGTEGTYQRHFLAYGQQGKLCPRCKKSKFVKTVLGGRGTYYCPTCQES